MSTHLKNMRQIGSHPQESGWNLKNHLKSFLAAVIVLGVQTFIFEQTSWWSSPWFMASQPTPPNVTPPEIRVVIASLIKGNRWLISPDHKALFVEGGTSSWMVKLSRMVWSRPSYCQIAQVEKCTLELQDLPGWTIPAWFTKTAKERR